ncbi:MAG: hypothetical protein ACP5VP_06085 [Candidatus Limnocylindrales bacterium]
MLLPSILPVLLFGLSLLPRVLGLGARFMAAGVGRARLSRLFAMVQFALAPQHARILVP